MRRLSPSLPMRARIAALFSLLLAGCSSGPPPLDWQSNSFTAMQRYTRNYLAGNTRAAQQEFASVKEELSATGRADFVARAELVRCALRTASLEFDDCPGFEKLRADADAEELAYADIWRARRQRSAPGRCVVAPRFSGSAVQVWKGDPGKRFRRRRHRLGAGLAPAAAGVAGRAGKARRGRGRPRGAGAHPPPDRAGAG